MIISVTERAEFKRCRRRWDLGSRNRQGLTPIVPATALALGTYVHAALGEWMMHPEISPKVFFLEAARDAKAQAIATYREQVGAGISDSELANLDDAILLGAYMVENYQKHWKSPLPEDFTVIAQEQRVTVPIPGTSHFLEGRLDGIIKDKRDRLYVLEHKTYAQRPRETTLRSNDQFLAYTWMLNKLDFGYKVAGVAYDGLYKRAAVPKTVDGRPGLLSDLFIRLRIERAPEELEEFERELAWEANDMASSPEIYKNRTSDGSCEWGCGFNELCLAMSRGEDVDYVRKSKYTLKADELEAESKDEK